MTFPDNEKTLALRPDALYTLEDSSKHGARSDNSKRACCGPVRLFTQTSNHRDKKDRQNSS